MKKSCLITNSGINQNTGGGIVSYNLVKALYQCTDVQFAFSNQKFPENKYENINSYSINPADYNYNADPFSMDYLAYHLLPDEPVDIVQTYGCPFGLTVEELKRKGAKVVADVAPHNLEISQEEHLKYAGSYPYPHLTDEMLWGLYSRNLRLSDVVIVHSHSSAKYIQQKARLKELPTVIPHGVNLPENIAPLPPKFTPSYFGALGMDKGIGYLVNAWLQCPYPELKMLIGGREAQTFKIDERYMPRFQVVGEVNSIADFIAKCSIGVFPSVTEGFNICALEMMAYGRPVIVAEGAGVSELIEDGKDGFRIPIRNVEAIQSKIQYFIDNPNEITRMGIEARKTAERYTWDKIRERYVSIWQKM